MSSADNPYAQPQGGYATTMKYGAAEPAKPVGQSSPNGGPAPVKDVTTASFTTDVLQESRRQPVLVDFWAPWCGPCKQLAPVLERVVAEAGGSVKLVKMNIDDHPSVAGQLGIQSIPAVIAFKNGQPVDGFMGAVPESQIREFVRRVGGDAKDAVAEALAAAVEARGAGDLQAAAQIYAAVLEEAPDNVDAVAGYAELLLDANEIDAAKQLIETLPEDKRAAPKVAGLLARIALADEVAAIGDPAELERRLSADPKDHQARFDLALIQNARGERADAADNLLAIMKADRGWKDDGARAQLLKLFEAWGMTDEATLSARRRLSSLLFS